jgi:hypothetical protein
MQGERGERGERGEDGEDGRDAVEVDILHGLDEERRYQRGTFAYHRGGLVRALRPTDTLSSVDNAFEKAGWAVVMRGIDTVELEVSDDLRELSFAIQLTDGMVFRKEVNTPALVYREIWKAGVYKRGDVVTYDGSLWVAKSETEVRPGSDPDAWRLAVRKGRDGKDGTGGKRGDKGDKGEPGKDLTHIDSNGRKW